MGESAANRGKFVRDGTVGSQRAEFPVFARGKCTWKGRPAGTRLSHLFTEKSYTMLISPNLRGAAASLRLIFCSAIALLCAGCDPSPPPATSATPPPTVAPTAAGETPAPVIDRHDISRDDGFETKVRYPALRAELAPLEQAMHAYAEQKKIELLAKMKEIQPAGERTDVTQPGQLDLDFTVATQTQDFVSALAEGEGEFGGAHPLPLRATFTQHLPSGKIITLTDLFADADAAIKIFSDEVRRRLEADFEGKLRQENPSDKQLAERIKTMRELVEQGTAPKAENFAAFLVDGVDGKAIGITLIFPAAQVAAYVDGPQQVEVPVKLFYDLIKLEYKDAFDKEDLKPGEKPAGS